MPFNEFKKRSQIKGRNLGQIIANAGLSIDGNKVNVIDPEKIPQNLRRFFSRQELTIKKIERLSASEANINFSLAELFYACVREVNASGSSTNLLNLKMNSKFSTPSSTKELPIADINRAFKHSVFNLEELNKVIDQANKVITDPFKHADTMPKTLTEFLTAVRLNTLEKTRLPAGDIQKLNMQGIIARI